MTDKESNNQNPTEESANKNKGTDANYTYNNDDQPLFDLELLKQAIKANKSTSDNTE